jgi:hypothetical protein
MSAFFARMRDRTTAYKAIMLFIYGLLTFLGVYYVGIVIFENAVFFRVFELLWFIHMLIICNQIQRSQSELILIALCALSPGIFNNILGLFAFR